MADAEVNLQQIERKWEKLVARAREDPWSLVSMEPEELKTLLLSSIEGLARLVGATAITVELGRWRARYYRKSLVDDDEWEEEDGELVCSVQLEDSSGCSIMALSIGLPDEDGPEVYARSAGEIAEIFLTGRVCEEGSLEPEH